MNPTDSSKVKKHKNGSKEKNPMKKNKKNVDHVKSSYAKENIGNNKELGMENVQDYMEEKAQSDVNDKTIAEQQNKLQEAVNEHSEIVKGENPVLNEAADEKTQINEDASVTKAAAPSIIDMLNHRDEKVRIGAIESLLKIGDKSVSYAFASCMKDESFQVRLGALRGLYKYGGNLATDYLIEALEDKHPYVRRRALIYLGWLRKKELVPYITGALADESTLVRKIATYTLGDLKDSLAIPHLIKALDDKDTEVKKGAIAALKRITRRSFASETSSPNDINGEAIEKWKEWWTNENTKMT